MVIRRSLIQERVRAGLRNARNKGKRLGRPLAVVSISEIERLRAEGLGWRVVAKRMGLGVGTVVRASQKMPAPSASFLSVGRG